MYYYQYCLGVIKFCNELRIFLFLFSKTFGCSHLQVQIPDVNPRDALAFRESELANGATPAFSMSAGDFLEVRDYDKFTQNSVV